MFLLSSSGATAATLDGTATIQTPVSGTMTYPAASTAQFTVSLPSGAACSGNTSTDGYHVWTYLVPQKTDVSTLTFSGSAPSTGYGLFDDTGSLQGPFNTAISDQIMTLPNDFEWGPAVSSFSLLTGLLDGGTSGVWEAGIACANETGTITDYWNTEVTFTASSSDPGGFTWSAVPGPDSTSSSTTTTVAVGATTTTSAGTTDTTTAGTTATTGAGSTATTTAGSTATTAASSTATTAASSTATTGPSSNGTAATSTGTGGGSSGSTGSGSGTTGALAFTGLPAPALKIIGAGFLLMGLGLVLLGGRRNRSGRHVQWNPPGAVG